MPAETVSTDIPLRLDRLPWSRWHWRVVIALGVTWIFDGLEVTVVGAIAGALREPYALGLTDSQIGFSASCYLAGAIVGALVFGRLTDLLGRKKLFLLTLAFYLIATLLTALSWSFGSFAIFRALTGIGIGGECAAMNSAVDELLPARVRGHADLAINGTYWAGTALGAASTLVLLNPSWIDPRYGWRACFALGAVLGVAMILVRRHVPESPRWLLMHGRTEEAERTVRAIEREVEAETGPLPPIANLVPIQVRVHRGAIRYSEIAGILLKRHLKRTILGLCLMITQAFAYNAIFFTYALVLARFYGVPASRVGLYLLPFSIGNLLGPLLLGRLFDTRGRKVMIAATYGISGVLLWITGFAFAHGWLTAFSQTALWCMVFFVASAAASSAYLTVSEIFPVEMRAMAIAIFYSVGTAAGGLLAPGIFGALIETGSRIRVYEGYCLGAALLIIASITAMAIGVPAERRSLESIA
jgi:MFS family permease